MRLHWSLYVLKAVSLSLQPLPTHTFLDLRIKPPGLPPYTQVNHHFGDIVQRLVPTIKQLPQFFPEFNTTLFLF